MSFFEELKRRNVFRVGIAYVITAWLLLQVIDLVLENVNAPDWVMQVFMLALAIGFPLAVIFAWAFEMTPEGIKKEKDVDRSKSITPQTGRTLNRVIFAVMALALAYLTYDKFVASPGQDTNPTVSATQTTAEEPPTEEPARESEKSIAVLPFVNMSSDPEQEYFADGISEEILNALAKVKELKVAGRTSSFAFKGKNEDLLAIGKVLRVNHILEGSVRKSGTRVRITAQLIKVDDGFHMWSETYDRELNDIFVVQDEISAAILTQLKAQLLGQQQLVTTETDTKAYELYLLAKQRIYDRTQASLEMAAKLLEQAVAIDSTYAPAYAQLGITTLLLSDRNYGTLPTPTSGENAKKYLETALQLDPENAEALAGMGLYFRDHSPEHQKAIDILRKALLINPNLVNANTWLANELDQTGKLREAMQIREETFRRDPLHRATFGNLLQKYVVMGQNEKALETIEGLRPYLPGNAMLLSDLGQLHMMSGELADALDYLRQAYEREPLNAVNRFWYGIALMEAGQYDLMSRIAPDLLVTLALSRLGRPEEALILGQQAFNEGQNPTFYFRALVENGRFSQLIEEVESRWPSLDDFVRDWPGRTGYGNNLMAFIAYAYRQLGRQAQFEDAMSHFKAALDAQIAEGADNKIMSVSQAYYAVLSNDYDTAISLLEKAFEQGLYPDTVTASAWPMFKPLNGDPRYATAKARMLARLNTELEKAGLEATAPGQDS